MISPAISPWADERDEVLRFARRMAKDGLVTGTSGNISRRAGPMIAITPRNRDYETMSVDDVSLVDLDGQPLAGSRPASTETPMHLAVYRAFDVGAVVHTHSPYATVIGTVVSELPAVHYLVATLGGPVRVAPYHLFGSDQLAAAVTEAGKDRSAVILGTHGAITWGADLAQAYRRSVTLEWLAALYWRACQLGSPRILTAEELDAVTRQLDRLEYSAAGQ